MTDNGKSPLPRLRRDAATCRERLPFFNRPYGTKMHRRTGCPAINRWAIITRPYGTNKEMVRFHRHPA